MSFCQTLLKISLFGGAADGAIIDLENAKEKIKVGANLYADSFFVNKEGCSIYYCAAGPGALKKPYIKKLFRGEDVF